MLRPLTKPILRFVYHSANNLFDAICEGLGYDFIEGTDETDRTLVIKGERVQNLEN